MKILDQNIRSICFFPTSSSRDYQPGGSPAEGGEGSTQPQELTPQQQHQQYLGDSRPELKPFPEIQWAGTPIPGKYCKDKASIKK